MGSETGAKWFVVIILYFTIITFTVALIGLTSDTDLGSVEDTSGTYCGSPRDIYEPYNGEPKDLTDISWIWKNYYESHIDCSLSVGVLGQSTCEDIDGCSWDAPTFLWWSTGDDTCNGEMNYPFIVDNGTQAIGLLGQGIADYTDLNGEDSKFICGHPSVINNESLCESLSCTWKYRNGINKIDSSTVEPKLSLLSEVWEVAKDVSTFRFDFGFDNTLINGLLYFLVFILPVIGLVLSLYVMVRS